MKPYKTITEQIDILISRGMLIPSREQAYSALDKYGYYRLSGYWYPLREFDSSSGRALDNFSSNVSFPDVLELYNFDHRLRVVLFEELSRLEILLRHQIGQALGRLDPLAHLNPELLSVRAFTDGKSTSSYNQWRSKFDSSYNRSKEDFVKHFSAHYSGEIPIWAAVEIMDWGMLSYLYGLSPNHVRKEIAQKAELTPPQFESWVRCLNVLRNLTAHQSRLFNRSFGLKPKVSNSENFQLISQQGSRLFGQLSLLQHLLLIFEGQLSSQLVEVLRSYPDVSSVPRSRLGLISGWEQHPLWLLQNKN